MRLTQAQRIKPGMKISGLKETQSVNSITVKKVLSFKSGHYMGGWILVIQDIMMNIWTITDQDHDVFLA